MALGTYSGGWRIIHTLGSKVIKLDPIHGFAAETTAASVIQVATHFGVPVSTTHTITAAIMGVGSTQRLSAVRWGVAGNIVTAWILTLPAAGLVGAGGLPRRRGDPVALLDAGRRGRSRPAAGRAPRLTKT